MPKTLNDWIKEFYPVEACDVKGGDKELLEHSLKKWRGATKENTETYNCEYMDYIITKCTLSEMKDQERSVFGFGYTTCALCQVHKYKANEGTLYNCDKCIIVLSGNPSCTTGGSAYVKSKNDPAPMIALLEKLLQETNKVQQ